MPQDLMHDDEIPSLADSFDTLKGRFGKKKTKEKKVIDYRKNHKCRLCKKDTAEICLGCFVKARMK